MDKSFLSRQLKNYLRTYDHSQKTVTGKGDDYTTGCLLDYSYFRKWYKIIKKDLSKQQALHTDPIHANKQPCFL